MAGANHLYNGLMAAGEPDRVFAEIPGSGGVKTRWYTYQHVEEVSARLANLLVTLGLKPGDRLAMQVPKSIEAIMLYLATVRAGGVFLPLNTAYTAAEVAYFLKDAEPAIFVCAPERHGEFAPLCAEIGAHLETLGIWTHPDCDAGTLLEGGLQTPIEFSNAPRDADDLAAILYTSGTTGRSKGAMLSHGNLLSNSATLAELWRFTKEDRLLHALPIFHTHGLFVATNVALLSGASVILLPGFSNDAVIKALPDATSLMGVPTFYTRLLDDARFTRELVAHMRLFVSGSAPLLAETHERFEARTGHRVLERYGMTETNMNTSNPYDGERRAGTVGFPLPDVELRVCDADGGTVPAGETGVIEVRGPNVFSGYWNMPEKTKEEFRNDGFFITGDLARIDEDGYIQIVGREKDLIISGGYNIYPKEIETILDDDPTIIESAVVGVPHPDFGEGVVGVVTAKDNFDAVRSLERLASQLARFKQPKVLHRVDELPRNAMGKVQKTILRDMMKDTFVSDGLKS